MNSLAIEKIVLRISTNRYLRSLRDGIIICMPLVIIGSLFLILNNLPVNGLSEYFKTYGIDIWLDKIVSGTFGIIGLVASFSIAYSLTHSWNEDGVSAGVISLASYFILTPFSNGISDPALPLLYLGTKGLFSAIVISIITSKIFHFFISRDIYIKMPDSVPPAVLRSFASLIPGFVTIALFGIVQYSLLMTGMDNIHIVMATLLHGPMSFLGGSLIGTVIAILINSVLWLVGIHPAATIGTIMTPIWLLNTDQNRLALAAGTELPNIITQPFMDNFVWMGGGGSTIGLIICMMLFSKSRQNKTLGKLALMPGIFNINEPLIFGFPLVFNLRMVIPFLFSPVIIAIVTYYSMALGLVHKSIGIVMPWTMPPIISGYFATGGHISGCVIQLIGIALSTLIYYPFFIITDRQQYKEEVQGE